MFLRNSICVTGFYVSLGERKLNLMLSESIGTTQNQTVLNSSCQSGWNPIEFGCNQTIETKKKKPKNHTIEHEFKVNIR
jgi:hypothetical protein